MKSFSAFIVLLFLGGVQINAQQVSGQISDAYSGIPIPNATVTLQNARFQLNILSDITGYYSVDSLSPGRYQIKIQQDGYQILISHEVFISIGKSLHFKHHLIPSSFEMETIVVRASDTWDTRANNQVEVIGIEQTERIAANFQDPARVVNAYAGVAQLNDQANHLSIRGLSPSYAKWYLEGMEIVNPNHTSNAGTLSDIPTQAGGGVLMFSSQVLGNTVLSKGPHEVQYSNSVSGIVDLNYRNPSLNETKYSASLSLIGLEASAEGPLDKSKQSSWMASYRYSTIGVLSALGVPLGDEDIRFQDAHLQMNVQTGKNSSLRLFGFWGQNQNIFEGKEIVAEREENKERFDIDFNSSISGVGVKYRSLLGSNAVLRAGTVYSTYSADRKEFEILASLTRAFSQSHDQDNRVFSSFIERQSKAGKFGRLTLGLQYKWIDDKSQNTSLTNGAPQNAIGESQRFQFRPYVEYLLPLSGKLTFEAGIAGAYWSNSKDFSPEPQVGLFYQIGQKADLSMRYQFRSQDFAQPITSIDQMPFENTPPSSAIGQLINLGYTKRVSPSVRFYSNLFYTSIRQTPIYGGTQYASQTFDDFPLPGVSYDGKERVLGIEVSYEQMITTDFFISANATVYKSQFETPTNGWQAARFNGSYILNLNLGKEYQKVTEKHQRTIGVSGRLTVLGGIRARPIDEEMSRTLEQTVYASKDYRERLPTYVRPDLSLYLFKNKRNHTIRWSLDIQNVASLKNTAYNYYDAVAQQIVEKKQLGIIPILSWRIGF